MSLVPVEGVLATVMKVAAVDESAAIELVRLGLYESLCDQIDEHREVLEKAATVMMAKRAEKARAALLRTHVGKALSGEEVPDDLPYAQGLAIIDAYVSKGLVGNALAIFNQRHPRDEKGQFARRNVRPSPAKDENLRLQAHATQGAAIAQQWQRAKLVDEKTPLTLHWRNSEVDPATGKLVVTGTDEEQTTMIAGEMTPDRLIEEQERYPDATLSGISIQRGQLGRGDGLKQRSALNAAAAFTSDPQALEALGRFAGQAPDPGDWDQAGREWNRSGDMQGMRRLKLTGQALNAVSAPGSTASMIGGLAQLVGDLGPEAEKVLGPGIRRTAYRYRGTERRPTEELSSSVSYANEQLAALASAPRASEERERIEANIHRRANAREADPASHITSFYAGRNLTRDQQELYASGDIAAAILSRNLPDEKVAMLSIASNEIPPSEGVIINADGHVVVQAQGFKGDHYLPFDLKNLGQLRGGQYVRTRLSGGPTTEDIYAGLMSGARQIEVVSHSGVFTVEFDPNLRGGRRYSDKARKMVGRYEALLGVLASGKQVREDLPSAEKSRLRREAYQAAGWDSEQGERNYDAKLKRRQLEASVGLDEQEIEAEAMARLEDLPDWRGASPSQRGDLHREMMGRVRQEAGESAYRMYRLDGPGYADALKALKQEFPYYIRRADWRPLPQWNEQRGLPRGDHPTFAGPDKGYVRPDRLTPFDQGARRGEQPEAEGEQGKPARESGQQPVQRTAEQGRQQAKPEVRLTDLASSAPGFQDALADSAYKALNMIGPMDFGEPIGDSYDNEAARNIGGPLYLKWAYNKHGKSAGLAKWLATEATDDDRRAIKQGLESYAHAAPGMLEQLGAAHQEPQVTQAVDDMMRLIDLAHPYAEPAPDPDNALPDREDPKPQPFADIIVLNTPEKLNQFLSNMEQQEPMFVQAVSALSQARSQGDLVRRAVTNYRNQGQDPAAKAQLHQMQRAWAFLKAFDVVEAAQALELQTGGPGKDQAPQGPDQPVGKSLSRGSLKPVFSAQSPQTKAMVRKYLESLAS